MSTTHLRTALPLGRMPGETLGHHLLDAVMTPAQARRFRHAPGLRVVIEAPTPAWIEPLLLAAAAMAPWDLAVGLDGNPYGTGRSPTNRDRIAESLVAGHRLVAVSHAPGRHVPPSLVARADMTIRTGHPTSAVIREAIRDATGVKPDPASESVGDRLDFFDLVSAIQMGSDARTCLRRLGCATANRAVVDRFPDGGDDLSGLHGYPGATSWAERLVADVEAWRRGETSEFDPRERKAVCIGPRGTGKASLVAAIGRSAGLPVIDTRVPGWFIDGDASHERTLHRAEAAFARAAAAAPAILFLDGIDALPPSGNRAPDMATRHAGLVGYVARFLDGTDPALPPSSRLIVIGTAASRDALAPELVLAGRLSRIVEIPAPDAAAMPAILRGHLGDDLQGIDLAEVVALADGTTGAIIAGWTRAARRRARIAGRPMTIGDLLAEASAPGNLAPGSWRESSVHETWPAAEPLATYASPVRPMPVPRPIGPTREVIWSQRALGKAFVPMSPGRGRGTAFGAEAFAGLWR